MSGRAAFVNFFGWSVGGAAHGMAVEFEAIGIVDQAVEDGVGKRGFVDDVVPRRDRELAGDQDRASPMAVFDDFHEVATLTGGQAFRPPWYQ